MKTQSNQINLMAAVVCLLTIILTACNKDNNNTANTAPPANEVSSNAVSQAVDTTKNVTGEAVNTITNGVSAATAQFTQAVADARQMISQNNFQGALDALNKLSGLQLSDEQTNTVNSLKTQIQALISKGAAALPGVPANGVGGLGK